MQGRDMFITGMVIGLLLRAITKWSHKFELRIKKPGNGRRCCKKMFFQQMKIAVICKIVINLIEKSDLPGSKSNINVCTYSVI